MFRHLLLTFFVAIFLLLGYFLHQNLASVITSYTLESTRIPQVASHSDLSKMSAFGHDNALGSLLWISAIQYIGSNVYQVQRDTYFGNLIINIERLHPYLIDAPLLAFNILPDEDTNNPVKVKNDVLLEQIGVHMLTGTVSEPGLCDRARVDGILKTNTTIDFQNHPELQDPCFSYRIPYALAFYAYKYLQDSRRASDLYKITAAHSESSSGPRVLSAILLGKSGARDVARVVFLDMAEQAAGAQDDALCKQIVNQIKTDAPLLSAKQLYAKADLLFRKPLLALEQLPPPVDGSRTCSNFLVKFFRELNLSILENDILESRAKGRLLSADCQEAKCALQQGLVSLLPRDFAFSDNAEIIYHYLSGSQRFEEQRGFYR